MKCVDCDIELTTQDALADEVAKDDEGFHHRECVEGEARLVSTVELAEANNQAHLAERGCAPTDYDPADEEIRRGEREEPVNVDPDRRV